MNTPYRVTLREPEGTGTRDVATVGAMVEVVSFAESPEYATTDVSIRVPRSAPVLSGGGSIVVLTGPHAETYAVRQVRPNRSHTRYLARALV